MTKQLSPLEEVLYKVKVDEKLLGQEVYLLKEDSAVRVAKYLKTFEIIKDKMVNICAFISWNNIVDFTYERYLETQLTYLVSAKTLTKDEFNLLKEVLK